jgi:uncharacterized protein YjbJ (UPF0337 family)
MNWTRIEQEWAHFCSRARQRWDKLSDDDVDSIEGKRHELSGRLQARYGIAKDAADKQIDAWLRTL